MTVIPDCSHEPEAMPAWPFTFRVSLAQHFNCVSLLSKRSKALFGSDVRFDLCGRGHQILLKKMSRFLVPECIVTGNLISLISSCSQSWGQTDLLQGEGAALAPSSVRHVADLRGGNLQTRQLCMPSEGYCDIFKVIST